MKGKLGATLFALVFAIPFGGVGAFATYGVVSLFGDSRQAEEWVLVQAKVEEAQLTTSRGSKGGTSYRAEGAYSYAFGGKKYMGRQLGFDALGGADNVGDWQTSMAAFLEEAKRSGKSIPVYVNPDNPAEAVVDREVRWAMVLFMGAFGLIFGGVGIGALVAIGLIWLGKSATSAATRTRQANARAKAPAAASDAWKGAGFIWVFAFFWNAISFPIAILALPEIIRDEEWVGLLVLLFPLIGILVLWGAISTTIGLLRRGKATIALQPEKPQAGSSFNGSVSFPRGARPGEAFKVRLLCNRTVETSNSRTTSIAWSKEAVVNAARGAEGSRLAFRFDIPADAPRSEPAFAGREARYDWRIEVAPTKGSTMASYGFDIEVLPPAFDAFGSPTPAFDPFGSPGPALGAVSPAQPTTPSMATATLIQLLGADAAAKLSAQQRAAFAEMPPDAQALAGKVVRNAPHIKKVFIAIVVLFFLIQIIGMIVAVFASS